MSSFVYLLVSPVSGALSTPQVAAGDATIQRTLELAQANESYMSSIDMGSVKEAVSEAKRHRSKAEESKGFLDAFFAARGYRKTSQEAYHKMKLAADAARRAMLAIERQNQEPQNDEPPFTITVLAEDEPQTPQSDDIPLPPYTATPSDPQPPTAGTDTEHANDVVMAVYTSAHNNDTVAVVTANSPTGFNWAEYIEDMQSGPAHADDAADEDAIPSDSDSDEEDKKGA